MHREPRGGWSSVWPFLLVAVIFAGIAVGVVSFLSDGGPKTPPAAEQSAGAGEPTASASEDAEGGEDAPADDASDEPADDAPTDGESDAATELPGDPSAANLAAPVLVFNDGAGGGQAAAGQGALATKGFTDVGAANVPDTLAGAYEASTVLYGADRADTASAVAEALGVDPANVQESDDVSASPEAVWVVLKTPVG